MKSLWLKSPTVSSRTLNETTLNSNCASYHSSSQAICCCVNQLHVLEHETKKSPLLSLYMLPYFGNVSQFHWSVSIATTHVRHQMQLSSFIEFQHMSLTTIPSYDRTPRISSIIIARRASNVLFHFPRLPEELIP